MVGVYPNPLRPHFGRGNHGPGHGGDDSPVLLGDHHPHRRILQPLGEPLGDVVTPVEGVLSPGRDQWNVVVTSWADEHDRGGYRLPESSVISHQPDSVGRDCSD